jgi:glycosyl transferase, family 25
MPGTANKQREQQQSGRASRRRAGMLTTYLINLDRSPDRLAHMRREFERVGVGFTRVAAVDGASLSDRELKDFIAAPAKPSLEPWLPGEIGCFLSHAIAWQMIASGSAEAAAVFEDDVQLADDVKPLLALSDWVPADADIVRLEANRKLRMRQGRRIPTAPGRSIYRVLSGTWGSAGYILTRRAAIRLVQCAPGLRLPVDIFLFKPGRSAVASGLVRYQIVPAVCAQDKVFAGVPSGFGTMIGSEQRTPAAISNRIGVARFIPWKKRPVPFRP